MNCTCSLFRFHKLLAYFQGLYSMSSYEIWSVSVTGFKAWNPSNFHTFLNRFLLLQVHVKFFRVRTREAKLRIARRRQVYHYPTDTCNSKSNLCVKWCRGRRFSFSAANTGYLWHSWKRSEVGTLSVPHSPQSFCTSIKAFKSEANFSTCFAGGYDSHDPNLVISQHIAFSWYKRWKCNVWQMETFYVWW